MATQLGNITKSLGREFGIIMSNMAGNELFSNSSLRENSIIISAPIDSTTLEDKGTYNIFVTDGDGNPIRLSYTIIPGNGLVTAYNGDAIRMKIDDESKPGFGSISVDNNGEIYVNKTNLIDAYTLTVNNSSKLRGEIAVVTKYLDPATSLRWGIVKADEVSTYVNWQGEWVGDIDGNGVFYINDNYHFSYSLDESGNKVPTGIISVSTQNLETVDDEHNRNGIIRHSSEMWRTIKAEDGKLSVLTYNLEKASQDKFGVVKSDEITVHSDGGTLSVITEGLEHATVSSYGIVKGDETTIKVNDGVLSVKTQNLDKATYTSLGVVIPDSYSMEVDENGKIYVRDFQSIESLLDTNPKEHDLFSKDIEDLKNRVSILETMHEAETIEMLIPVGETRTILPKPVLNEQNQIENDPITKTVPFLLKTNCKYNVKVDYELNENPQVKVISLQVGDKKYASFSQEIFDETGNTTTTLNITFSVSNYTNKENNCDNVNTKVFVTVSSINDSAIKQTATHIFNRWNTEAFTPDPEPEIIPDEPGIPITSTLIIHKNSGKLEAYENSEQGITKKEYSSTYVSYGLTNTTNFYFTYTVDGTYTYNDPSGKIYSEELSGINQSVVLGTPTISIREYYPDSHSYGSTPNWLEAELDLNSTYNTTKAFNVLNVKSTKGIGIKDRMAFITLSLPASETIPTINEDLKIDQTKFIGEKIDLTNPRISIIDELKRVKENLNLIEVPATNTSINNITRTVSNVKKSSAQIISSISEKIIDKNISDGLKQKFNEVRNTLEISESTLNDAIENSTPIELSKKITNVKKAKALEELSYIQKVANTMNSKYTIYTDILSKEANSINTVKTLVYPYTEYVKRETPKLMISSRINKNESFVRFTMERSKDTLVNGTNNWGVNIKYVFVDKNNTPVNIDGSTNNINPQTYKLTASYDKISTPETTVTSSEIQTAQSGVYTKTTEKDKYYDVISINAEITNRNFLFISGDDTATIRFSSYSWDDNKGGIYSTIPDNIYLVLQCWNVESNKWVRTYNLRGYNNGKTFDLVDALNFRLLGLSLYSDGKNPSFTLKSGTRKYKCGEGNTIPSDSTSSSYKEKRGTEQIPVKVNNNITGIKIISADIIPGSFIFEDDPIITISSTGSWVATDSSSNSKSYAFGDAYISSISVSPWDDYEMKIKFHISPGSNTNVPLGATINNEFTNSYGKTNFIFLEDSSSYDYKQLYSDFEFTSTPWTNTGCDIFYKLYNKFSLNYDSVNKTKTIMYNDKTGVVSSVYTPDGIPYAKSHPQRDNTYDGYALLRKMSAIKFWFTVSVQSYNMSDKFYVSKSSISDKILLGKCQFMDGESKSINIVNALYTSYSKIIDSTPISNTKDELKFDKRYNEIL